MDHLLAAGHLTSLLHDGVRVVITGPPNAGKSSLLNALVGADRVIVSEQPGTTRDYVEERITLGPYVLRLVDTAGIGETKSPIESQGMRKAIDQVDRSHLVLCVVDTTEPAPNLPDGVAKRLSEKAAIVIENKTDRAESQEHLEWLPHLSHLRLSALTGDGLDSLKRLFRTRLEEKMPSAEKERVLVNARHAQALKEAKHGLQNALEKMRRGSYNELIASDLRISLAALGEITGKVDNEAMLDALFGKFCIGK
jgi:tRNA modification GTPase